MYHCLDQYPIQEVILKIQELQQETWDVVTPVYRDSNRKAWPIEICINHFISPFRHLKLDERYDVFCYLEREYHGSLGLVAAFENKDSRDIEYSRSHFMIGTILPENAMDPMEIVYCDGTPEGYLEAVLYHKMIQGFSRMLNTHVDCDHILFKCPKNLTSDWDMLMKIDTWCPKVQDSSLYCYVYTYVDGFVALNPRSRIYLKCYSFSDDLDMRRAFGMPTKYPKKMSSRNRFQTGKHCCVFMTTSIQVGEESGRK